MAQQETPCLCSDWNKIRFRRLDADENGLYEASHGKMPLWQKFCNSGCYYQINNSIQENMEQVPAIMGLLRVFTYETTEDPEFVCG